MSCQARKTRHLWRRRWARIFVSRGSCFSAATRQGVAGAFPGPLRGDARDSQRFAEWGRPVDAFEGFVRPFDDVERVGTYSRLRQRLAGGVAVDGAHVHADRGDLRPAVGAEGVVEAVQRGLGAAFGDPGDPAGVVVTDDGQELAAT